MWHFSGSPNLTTLDFTCPIAPEKVNGLEFSRITYCSTPHAAVSMLGSISETDRDSILEIIQKSKFFSSTIDSSTDDATIEQETLSVCIKRFVKVVVNHIQPHSKTCTNL